MVRLSINLGERSYPIYVGTDYSGLAKCITSARLNGKMIIVTDTNVSKFQAKDCIEDLQNSISDLDTIIIEAGEDNKTLETVKNIYHRLVELKADRNTTLIALGGGVVGDITGFVASTYLRGINFVQVPTTMLAQADSSVGGKVGVDFEGGKNLIGAFYQPKFVYINVNSLKTLPVDQLKSGLAEVIKHGLILDEDFFDYIDYNLSKIINCDENVLQYLAKKNCTIKGFVVEQDEKESDLRAILNFGHTYGHAIESESNFRMLHGECVSIGIFAAYKMAAKLGMVEKNIVNKIEKIFCKTGLPISVKGLDLQNVYNRMFSDKKVKNNKLNFILPKKIGEVIQCTIDNEKLIKEVLSEILC